MGSLWLTEGTEEWNKDIVWLTNGLAVLLLEQEFSERLRSL